jgi:hypothetical protein
MVAVVVMVVVVVLVLQDAAEYLQHLLELINRTEHAAAARLGITEGEVGAGGSPALLQAHLASSGSRSALWLDQLQAL